MQPVQPDVFNYLSAQQFLFDLYKYRKNIEVGFSYERWARELKIKSRSYLRSVVTGKYPLSDDLLPPLLRGLKLPDDEKRYFTLLVQHSSARSKELQTFYMRDIVQLYKHRAQTSLVSNPRDFLSDSTIPALFSYLAFEGVAHEELDRAASDLRTTKVEIENALSVLIANDLAISEISTDGTRHYRTTATNFRVPPSPGNSTLVDFHKAGIEDALKATGLPIDQRRLYSTFLTLDSNQFSEVQQLLEDFNQKLLQIVAAPSGKAERVYRLNQQIFALSEELQRKN